MRRFPAAVRDCLRGNAPAPADKRPFTDPQSPAFRTASKKTPGRRNNRRQHAHCSPATGGSQPLNWRPRTSLDPGKWAAGCSCRLTTCPLVSSTLREDDLMSTTVAQPAPRAWSATARGPQGNCQHRSKDAIRTSTAPALCWPPHSSVLRAGALRVHPTQSELYTETLAQYRVYA
jgi:hypothetical protein